MFEQLTQRLQGTLRTLRGSAKVDEATLKDVSRELRLALLEADVHFGVVRDFLARVRERALHREVAESLTPGQQVIKIVHEELVDLLGGTEQELRFAGRGPHVVMIVGLQGAGKTTSTGKLATWLRGKGHSPLLVSVDVHRPAAREQLRILCEQSGLMVFDGEGADPVALARGAVTEARRRGDDVVLVDTAGRLHIDDDMMAEARAVAAAITPSLVLYVADSLVGQDAVEAATAFAQALPIDGHVLTKLDGDSRGGAALSVVAVTGKPIFFAGVGETIQDFELFHPERVASRILGMGDVMSLIEKVGQQVDLDSARGLEKKVRKGDFTLEDFRDQLTQVRKMGPLSQIMEMLPGAAANPALAKAAPDESALTRTQAIIDSMTIHERRKPQVIKASRRRRIAAGSGTTVQDVNRLLKQFAQTRKLMKKLGKRGRRGQSWANLPGF